MLSVIKTEKPTFDSGIEYNGKRLLLLPATKTLCEKISRGRNGENGDVIEQSYNMAAEILNANTLGTEVEKTEVEELDIFTIKNLIEGYASFIGNLKNDPN